MVVLSALYTFWSFSFPGVQSSLLLLYEIRMLSEYARELRSSDYFLHQPANWVKTWDSLNRTACRDSFRCEISMHRVSCETKRSLHHLRREETIFLVAELETWGYFLKVALLSVCPFPGWEQSWQLEWQSESMGYITPRQENVGDWTLGPVSQNSTIHLMSG